MAGKWGHGFKPLNMEAALSKAHGSRQVAEKLLGRRKTVKVSMARPVKRSSSGRKRKR